MSKKFEYVDDNPGSYFSMLVESIDKNNKLEEADTLAKPIKKDFKNRYKSYDRKKDYINKHNQEMTKKIPANASEEDVELIKDVFFKKEPKFDRSIGDNFKGLETKDYPFYVTYYQEVPFYHPEEGGYYVAGVQAMQSEGFDSKEEALKSLQDAASAWGMEKLSSTEYGNLSKYIGDSQYAVLETSKTYLSREKGDTKYESLKEDKFVPQDKMSKKAKKELNDKKRGTWGNTNPVTRVQPNKKAYNRKRDSKVVDERLDKQSDFELTYALDELEELSNYYRSRQDNWSKEDSEEFLKDINSLLHRTQHLFRKAKVLGESKKLNESSDGWNKDNLYDLKYILDKLENLNYEINNCVRGAYSYCKTYEELGHYISDLGEKLADLGSDVSLIDEEEDDEFED